MSLCLSDRKILYKHSLVPDNVDNLLVNKGEKWTMQITRKRGQLYLELNEREVLYTARELRKTRLHFFHPSKNKLFNLIARANLGNPDRETKEMLKFLTEACTTCQRFYPKPQTFQVCVPGNKALNQEIALHLIFLDKLPVLHVVDIQTQFVSFVFVRGKTSEGIWRAFLKCCVGIYIGYLVKIEVDQEK